jgi:tRNA (guanine6-N2)-methyltransferase
MEATESYFELEVIPGLAKFAQAELQSHTHNRATLLPSEREDRVRFSFFGPPSSLLTLRQTVAVHRIRRFSIPRPKALLGHQNFELLIDLMGEPQSLHQPGSFSTFRVSAAGSTSSVYTRIKSGIEARTGLRSTEEAGDLHLAVRRALSPTADESEAGWEVVVRLSPRPLSTRPWRVCDMPGALNGTVASVMMSLTQPSMEDQVINLACGSGTLLIERFALGPICKAVGCDIDPAALACAQENLKASKLVDEVNLIRCDAGRVPLPEKWGTTVCVDLPFGMLVSSHEKNASLYPRLLREAARLLAPNGKAVVITQEVRLLERIIADQGVSWSTLRTIPIKLPANTRDGYIRPRVYLLNRK